MVQVETCCDISTQQQISAGHLYWPEWATNQLNNKAFALYKQVQVEKWVCTVLDNAKWEQIVDKKVLIDWFRFEYTKEVLNEMASNIESKKTASWWLFHMMC